MKFRKKPVVIEAIQWDGENWYDIGVFVGQKAHIADEHRTKILLIDTLEGQMKGNIGDWIIKGVKGEFYPCKPDIFQQTYEPAENQIDDKELIEQIAKHIFHEVHPVTDVFPDCWGIMGTMDDESWRRLEKHCRFSAKSLIKKFLSPYIQGEKEEYEKRIAQLKADRLTYCAYCGEEFPIDARGTPDAVSNHIMTCPKHPIYQMKQEYEVKIVQARAEAKKEIVEKIQKFVSATFSDAPYKPVGLAMSKKLDELLAQLNTESNTEVKE